MVVNPDIRRIEDLERNICLSQVTTTDGEAVDDDDDDFVPLHSRKQDLKMK